MEHELASAKRVAMTESERTAILRALADENALRVFAQVVVATGTPVAALRGRNQYRLRDRLWCLASNGAAGQHCGRCRPAVDRGQFDDRRGGWDELAH
jgi:hypothetical protein